LALYLQVLEYKSALIDIYKFAIVPESL